MLLSVIIPTYNRCKILKDCLEVILNQDMPKVDYEVIVVDDGSTDDTEQLVREVMKTESNVSFLKQQHGGQGVARNLALKHAKGDIVVLIGDDIIVKKNFLTEHLRFHLRHPGENEVVLGYTDWHPKLTLTPFMKWLTDGSSVLGKFGGHQFAYEKLEGKEVADFNFFYTSNISLKRNLLLGNAFDPEFSGYGWEDIELGYRLQKEAGMILYYNKNAVGYHDHAMTEESLKRRMFQVGASAWIINKKYPELKKIPGVAKKVAFMVISSPVIIYALKLLRALSQGKFVSLYFYALSKKYFLEGVKEGKNYLLKNI